MKKILKQFSIVAFSLALIGISINMFLAPHNIAAGGVSGIGVLLEKIIGIDRSVTVLVLNIIMLFLAFFMLGRQVFIKSVVGSLLLPISLAVVPEIKLVQDRVLSVVVGSIIFACAVAILYRNEASSGGTTIPPLILKKYFGLNTSIGLLGTDMIIVIFNIFVFGIESFLFAATSLIITSAMMTYIETGMKRKKAVIISSEYKTEEIRLAIAEYVTEKITAVSTMDTHAQKEKTMLVVLLENQDYPTLLRVVDKQDQDALVIAYSVAEVHGMKFDRDTKNRNRSAKAGKKPSFTERRNIS